MGGGVVDNAANAVAEALLSKAVEIGGGEEGVGGLMKLPWPGLEVYIPPVPADVKTENVYLAGPLDECTLCGTSSSSSSSTHPPTHPPTHPLNVYLAGPLDECTLCGRYALFLLPLSSPLPTQPSHPPTHTHPPNPPTHLIHLLHTEVKPGLTAENFDGLGVGSCTIQESCEGLMGVDGGFKTGGKEEKMWNPPKGMGLANSSIALLEIKAFYTPSSSSSRIR